MKFLVTGGTGFTGSHLVRLLLNKGHQVVSLTREICNFDKELSEMGATFISGSITNRNDVKKSLQWMGGVDGVFHLAAAFRKINIPDQHYWDINVEGTRILCEEALKMPHLKKFVHCSTQGVHGGLKEIPGDENSPIHPEDYYQETKYEGEKVVLEFAAKGLKSVILRPMGIYGPGDKGRFVHLYRFCKKGFFFMFGNGSTLYHAVYVENLCDAFWMAFESSKKNGEQYLIGNADYVTLNTLIAKVGESLGKKVRIWYFPFTPMYLLGFLCELLCKPFKIAPPLFRRRVNWYRKNRAFKIDKARKELGYEPKISLEEGLSRTAQWYLKNNYLS
jgi:nucleoside-diphosphate-sugar epimerase